MSATLRLQCKYNDKSRKVQKINQSSLRRSGATAAIFLIVIKAKEEDYHARFTRS